MKAIANHNHHYDNDYDDGDDNDNDDDNNNYDDDDGNDGDGCDDDVLFAQIVHKLKKIISISENYHYYFQCPEFSIFFLEKWPPMTSQERFHFTTYTYSDNVNNVLQRHQNYYSLSS